MRANLASVVRGDARLALVDTADAAELGALVLARAPDVVLVDREAGGDALRAPRVELVDEPERVWESLRLDAARGPLAILARDAAPREIVAAVVAVAAGLVALQPRVFATAGSAIGARDLPLEAERESEPLTSREIEVLGELARGIANKTIAVRLGISEHTVKFHVASILAKLGAASRTEAVTRGARLGLVML